MTDAPLILVDVLKRTSDYLRDRGVTKPRLEAELILSHVLGLERLAIYLNYDRPMSAEELDALRPLVGRRGKREPLSWVLGQRGFHNIELRVLPGVLDPRPDTEALVEQALAWMDPPTDEPVFVADVGCGSGAVGLAIAAARPDVRLYAIDPSPEALEATRLNVDALGLGDRVAVLRGVYTHPVPQHRPIDWVVSNPPYIPSAEIAGLMPEVSQHEPRLALDGGADGLDIYRVLVPLAFERAKRGLLVEIGHDQAPRVTDLFRRAGFVGIEATEDLAGNMRVIAGKKP